MPKNKQNDVTLRDVVDGDLPIFFEHYKDPDANYMAAFTAKNPLDQSAFQAHWDRILSDENIIIQTILYHEQVTGHVLSYEQFNEREVSYWIGKEFWGKGIATKALSLYLSQVKIRPLYGRAAKDNFGSIRVLEKCGFRIAGESKGYSNARHEDVKELTYILEH